MYDVIFVARSALFPDGGSLNFGSMMSGSSDMSVVDGIRQIQQWADKLTGGWTGIPEVEMVLSALTGDEESQRLRQPSVEWHDSTFVRCHLMESSKGPNGGPDGYLLTGYVDPSRAAGLLDRSTWQEIEPGVYGISAYCEVAEPTPSSS